MHYIERIIIPYLIRSARRFNVVAVLGPRRAGKSTVVQKAFPHHVYFNLEDKDPITLKPIHTKDTIGKLIFELDNHPYGVIIDEAQAIPEIFGLLYTLIEKKPERYGHFIITGSQNYLFMENITQSLAGRIALKEMHPYCLEEMRDGNILHDSIDKQMFYGCFPNARGTEHEIREFYNYYINTYLERDIHDRLGIVDTAGYRNFMKVCAGYSSNIIKYEKMAQDVRITMKTLDQWLSALYATYMLKLSMSYSGNVARQAIRNPKIYFCDTGIMCRMLDIRSIEELKLSPYRGHIFETYVMSEFMKYEMHHGESSVNMYFFRDDRGYEIDFISKKMNTIYPVEIKASDAVVPAFFKNVKLWNYYIKQDDSVPAYAVYAGDEIVETEDGIAYPWHKIDELCKEIIYTS